MRQKTAKKSSVLRRSDRADCRLARNTPTRRSPSSSTPPGCAPAPAARSRLSTCNGSLAPQDSLPNTWARDGELTVGQIADRLGVSDGTVYAWIETGKLAARRGPANRLYIPYGPDVERECRRRVANSVHLPTETKIRAAGGAV